jgi:hypothetical protein
MECWVYPVSWVGSFDGFISTLNSVSAVGAHLSRDGVEVNGVATAWGTTLQLGQWTHLALTRSGTSLRLFVNGAVTNTATNSANIGSSSAFAAGRRLEDVSNYYCNAYISNARIVKGTAVYTAAFTPSTAPLTAISGTSILLNATNAGILDNAMMNDLETVGNAQISTSVKKYGTGSMYFDGTGDWLSVPNSQNFNFSNGNFTVEGWVYCTNTSSRQDIFTTPANASGFNGLSFGIYNGNFEITMCWSTGSWQILFQTAGSITANTWYHFAVVRNSGTVTVYINGSSTYTNTGLSTSSLVFGTDPATISYGRVNQSDARYLYGYIDDLRITKGVARYTANFTPPTSQVQDQ